MIRLFSIKASGNSSALDDADEDGYDRQQQ